MTSQGLPHLRVSCWRRSRLSESEFTEYHQEQQNLWKAYFIKIICAVAPKTLAGLRDAARSCSLLLQL